MGNMNRRPLINPGRGDAFAAFMFGAIIVAWVCWIGFLVWAGITLVNWLVTK